MKSQSIGLQVFRLSFLCSILAFATPSTSSAQEWHELPIPQSWKSPLSGKLAPIDGYGWFRSEVVIPREWTGKPLHILVEPIDDARAVYINGTPVGKSGEFPPRYRSGLGEPGRFEIPAGIVKYGEPNQVAVKTYYKDGRSNFSVAAPAVYTDSSGIKLEGSWFYRAGDADDSATASPDGIGSKARFDQVEMFEDLELFLRRREGDHDPYSPAEALKTFVVADDLVLDQPLADPDIQQPLFINFDERGRLWVLEYRQYPDPAGLKMVSRDKFLRTVYDKVPAAPPNHVPGLDRISIHEDTTGDGQYDKHSVFVDGLNIATSFVQGLGGVWVLNPPYLLFYPDHDRDDVPDSDPVVHLAGFGLEDSHSVVNSLRWGPDGWLYAAQGSTVTGNMIRPGVDSEPIRSMGQLIWRYHPASGRYEIFSEGGGNTFGVEIDDLGRVFSGTNGGNARGYYYVQGGYSQKSFGKHGELSNPYAFGYFPAMKHHDVPRFTHNFVIYSGGTLPASYNGKLFGIEPLQGQIVLSDVDRDGSSFKTADLSRPLKTDDQWFRPVDIKLGPDGGVYVADLYEQRIDHSSHYAGRIHKESGRIYRLRGRDWKWETGFDYGTLPGTELLARLDHPNRWHRQTAQRILADRGDRSLVPEIVERLRSAGGQLAVELLWALNHCGGLDARTAPALLEHEEAYVRLWTVRLLADNHRLPGDLAGKVAELARRESYVDVRSQLACSSRRLPPEQALPIVQALLEHDEDANDPHLPLLVWWAVESLSKSPGAVIELVSDAELWSRPLFARQIAQRLMRRFALAGQRRDLLVCAELLKRAPGRQHTDLLLAGFEEAYQGRSMSTLPEELIEAMRQAGGGSLALRVRQAIPTAISEAIDRLGNSQIAKSERSQLAALLGEIKAAEALSPLLERVRQEPSGDVRAACIAALQNFQQGEVATTLIEVYGQLSDAERRVAEQVVAARPAWILEFIQGIREQKIAAETIPTESVRRMLLHDSEPIRTAINAIWGEVGIQTTAEMRAEIARVAEVINEGSGNPYEGRNLFAQRCGKCHTLFGRGGQIGPDLSSYKRDDLQRVLLNVINPSAEIREGFENTLVLTSDGRLLNGFLADSDNRVVVLRSTDGQVRTIDRNEIEEMQNLPVSVMPTELLDGLNEQQLRDLFAFFRSTQPLP